MTMMKSGFSGPFVLLLLLSSIMCGLGSVVSKQYIHIHSHYTWEAAQSHCKRHYIDLATIYTQSDENLMTMTNYHAWIGLYIVTTSENSYWRWSNGKYSYFYAWASHEPGSGDGCATAYYTNRKYYGHHCGETFFFFCHKEHPNHYTYTFVPQSKSRAEALQYCRSKHDDLATFPNTSDLNSAVVQQNFPVWTGLYKDVGTWRWSSGVSEYRNWDSSQPGSGNCVTISSSGKKLSTQDCATRLPFICFKDNLLLVKENKTWLEAMEHCRALNYELISVQPGEDHGYVTAKAMEADTDKVWAGLRFLAGEWLWIDGKAVSYPDLPLCPAVRQHCGTISKNNSGSMETADCTEKRNFLCYRV